MGRRKRGETSPVAPWVGVLLVLDRSPGLSGNQIHKALPRLGITSSRSGTAQTINSLRFQKLILREEERRGASGYKHYCTLQGVDKLQSAMRSVRRLFKP
jgi:hypothetical protein